MSKKSLTEDISGNIRKTRNQTGMTQAEMAQKMNISLNAYIKLENGTTNAVTESFRKFSEVTNVPLSSLVRGYGEKSEEEQVKTIKEECERRIQAIEKACREEKEIMRKEIERLHETINDKNDIIATDKKLIRQLEKEK